MTMRPAANPVRKPPLPALFQSPQAVYHADTCEQLKAAAARAELRLAGLGRGGYPGQRLPPQVLPGVPSLGFWDAPHDQHWGLDWHRNEGLELTFLARGRLDFAVDADTFRLESGQLTLTRPWQQHRVGNPHVQASRLLWVILDVGVRRPNEPWHWPQWLVFDQKDLHRLTTLLRQCEQPVWEATPALRQSFEAIASQLPAPTAPVPETRLKLLLNELLLELLQLLESKRLVLQPRLASTRRTVELFLARLPEHLAHDWTLENMAAQCGLGRSRFAHYCEELTNLSPARYLMRCRLEAAARLLRQEPDRSVTDIALACGFSSSQYFANVFQHAYHQSPSAARAKLNLKP